MKKLDKNSDYRREKIVERQNLEKRKTVKDKRYHIIEDDDIIEALERTFMHEQPEAEYE